MSVIRVALADDHPVVLAGVKALLQSAPGFEVVGEAVTGTAALAMICEHEPDVAVLDISMPDLNGLDLADRLALLCPEVKLLALTVHEDLAYVQRLLQSGVRGYLLKRSASEDLPHAIRAVASGGVYLDPAVAAKVLPRQAGATAMAAGAWAEDLSPRELEVLRLTAQGYANKQIASDLDVSIKSVETYKARAAAKLGLRNRADIVRYGATLGWIDGLERR
jgi:DNA-binding NarL/FixJ family response regulator